MPLIALDRKSKLPLHKQIYEGLRTAIIRRALDPGQRVPSSRDLAADLHISRIPVLNAYAQLLVEGYFEARTGSGTFVSAALPDAIALEGLLSEPNTQPILSGPRRIASRVRVLPQREPLPWIHGWGPFGLHQPALEHFPHTIWSSLVTRHCRNPRIARMHHIDPLGSMRFREAVCNYLRTARGVRCDARQIMIVSGSQQALDITARVLLNAGDSIWVEKPGYNLARSAFLSAGCRLIHVPVDASGLDVAQGIRMGRNARAAHVTPSHQFPLGVTMSASRRMQLLQWAQKQGAWIIEDDYDSEYRHDGMPIASLQGLDPHARVIYVGTFSKVLFPSLRVGYIVIPPDLVDAFATVRLAMDIFPAYLHQEALADFILEGHFARHIRKMRTLYRERRDVLLQSMATIRNPALEITGTETGMHFAALLPDGYNDQELACRAAETGLWLWPLSPAYASQPARHGFVLGYGSTPVKAVPRAVQQLSTLLHASKPKPRGSR
jgi:GntR family transcriptional regulator/MocR family aminotransferase